MKFYSKLMQLYISFASLKYINVAMVTILKNATNIITAIGELYMFRKRQNNKVWAAMFMMVNYILHLLLQLVSLGNTSLISKWYQLRFCNTDHFCNQRRYHGSHIRCSRVHMAACQLRSNRKLFSEFTLAKPVAGESWCISLTIHNDLKILCHSLLFVESWTKQSSQQSLALSMRCQWCCWIISCRYLLASSWSSYWVNGDT